jgi:hypothetical protein
MKLQLQIEARLRDDIMEVIHCAAYWNKQGQHVYDSNKAGKMGTGRTRKHALVTPFDSWLLDSISEDINVLIENKPQYASGRAGSHVWLTLNNERILMIYVR